MVNGVRRTQGGQIVPALRYRDAAKAIDWLCAAFGFQTKMVVPGEGGHIAHAELTLGNGMIMLGDAETDYSKMVEPPAPPKLVNTQGLYVVVEDADAHYARAKAAGAEIVLDLKSQDYGGRDYTCRDLEGHLWTFGTYDPWLA
ncbi:MAG: VOC family protein [Methyloceanibacter sp.]